MKLKKIIAILIMIISIIAVLSFNVYAEDTTGELKWTDMSKSEITLEKNLNRYVKININNIENTEEFKDYNVKFIITDTNNKPEVNKDIFLNEFKSFIYNTEKKELSGDCTSYVELNQDLYLWVCERKYINDQWEFKYLVEGKKLDRNPTELNIFSNTFIAYSDTQIVFNVPWDKNTNRNINIKIGKISDENILKSLKNNSNDAWKQLLSYAKQSKTIYNEKITSELKENVIRSNNNWKIDLKGLLEDKSYYYLYTEFDDENGKYYPIEGLTFAMANVYEDLEDKPWFLFFYGDDKFKWNLNEGNVETDNISTKKEDDSTVVNKTKLPNTGAQITIIGIIVIITGFAIVFKSKYRKYKGIK